MSAAMPPVVLRVADDFTTTPGGRLRHWGPDSAEEFYEKHLAPAFALANCKGVLLVVDLDGTAGYPTSWLDEAFSRLAAREGRWPTLERLRVICRDEPYLVQEIFRSITEYSPA
jgi:hypothetical protein